MNSPETPTKPTALNDGIRKNVKLGLVLFFIYLAIYLIFILLSAFAHDLMGRPALGGMNLAVVYGFGLIIGAFLLALVYMALCKSEPAPGPDLTEGALAEKMEQEEGAA